MSNLTPTARVILGLLRLGAETGYEVKQITDRSTRFFWGASYGQIYPELRRLEQTGLVRSRDEPRGGLTRRVYELTPTGERAFDDWLTAEGPERFEMRDEGLLRLFFGAALTRDDLLALARRRREWAERSLAEFLEVERYFAGLGDSPQGAVLDYGIELMEWYAAWFGALEERLRNGRGPRSRPSPRPGTAAPVPR